MTPGQTSETRARPRRLVALWLTAALLLVNSGYLIAARGADLFHAAQILLHPILGIAALKLLLWGRKAIGQALRNDPFRTRCPTRRQR